METYRARSLARFGAGGPGPTLTTTGVSAPAPPCSPASRLRRNQLDRLELPRGEAKQERIQRDLRVCIAIDGFSRGGDGSHAFRALQRTDLLGARGQNGQEVRER